ncbi:MAG: hypothetical protein ACOZAM_28255 [Pseudomonadota bacterium]
MFGAASTRIDTRQTAEAEIKAAGIGHLKLSACAAALACTCLGTSAFAEQPNSPNAVTFLVGRGTDTDFTTIISQPWKTNFVDLTMLGVTYSYRLGTLNELFDSDTLGYFGDHLMVEPEAGAAYRFGLESQGEFWGSLYFRYDGLPWNDTIYTTLAINTGLSILTESSDFERDRSDGDSSLVLHNFSPEITFASPDYKDIELVLRLHHRSGIFGTIDGVYSGSSFITTGLRVRF